MNARRILSDTVAAYWTIVMETEDRFPGALQQVRAHGVETVASPKPCVVLQRGHELESRLRAVHHRHGDSVVQRDQGISGHALEHFVQRHDLWPVRVFGTLCLIVNGRDRGLKLIFPDQSPRERRAPEPNAAAVARGR